MDERKGRVYTIVPGLIVQLAVSLVLAPWDATSESEFYAGVKVALAIGLLANVLTRLVMMRWTTRVSPSRGAPSVATGGFWYVLISFVFALVLLIALVGLLRIGLI